MFPQSLSADVAGALSRNDMTKMTDRKAALIKIISARCPSADVMDLTMEADEAFGLVSFSVLFYINFFSFRYICCDCFYLFICVTNTIREFVSENNFRQSSFETIHCIVIIATFL